MRFVKRAGLLAALAALAWGSPAGAQTIQDLQAENQALAGQLKELAQELQQVQQRLDANEKAIAASGASDVKVSTQGGIKVETADGDFSAQLGGRVQADAAFYGQDKSRMGDGTQIRRLYVTLGGTVMKDWDYKAEVDFGNNATSIRDAYIAYNDLGPFKVTAGHFKEPFGLEELASDNYITFLERATNDSAFVPSRHVGAQLATNGGNWSAAFGAFGGTAGTDPSGEGDEGFDLTGRATFDPYLAETDVVHLGVGVRYRDPNSETTTLSSKPESNVTGASFVTTGSLAGIENMVAVGPEAAAVYGPLSLQGEFMRQYVYRATPRDDLTFDGWYVYGSYFLTGESRPYDPKSGTFGRVKPLKNAGSGGYGAWEVAVRYSLLDLTNGSVSGGTERNVTAGLNWYANPYVRVMFNYVHVNNDNKATGNSANLLPSESFAGDDDPNVYQVRAQVYF